MTPFASALYTGSVTHNRLRPKRHSLRYRLYSMLVDLDELPRLSRELRLFSYNSFNLFSLHDRDFGDGGDESIRARTERHLRAAGMPADGPIRLFTLPRVLGYAFNPLSIFFCYRSNHTLLAILYEVHNTFGERHAYLIPVQENAGASVLQDCSKALYVSPFIDMKMRYQFHIVAPDARMRVKIVGADESGPLIVATQIADRVKLTDSALARVFFTHPLVTLKVIGAIHWEALQLCLKGVPIQSKPRAPTEFVTLVQPAEGR